MFVLLLSICFLAGYRAEDPSALHYGLEGKSVCLPIHTSPVNLSTVTWKRGNHMIVQNRQINPTYVEKVEFNTETFSLCIKELTGEDRGTYVATETDKTFFVSTVTHTLIVEEAVPRPVMTLIPSSLLDGFNASVNCSTGDGWARADCDEYYCRVSHTSLSKINITIYCANEAILCQSNNHVSTNNISLSSNGICESKNRKPLSLVNTILFRICGILILLPCLLLVQVWWFSKRSHLKQSPQMFDVPPNVSPHAPQTVDVPPNIPKPAGEGSNVQRTCVIQEVLSGFLSGFEEDPTHLTGNQLHTCDASCTVTSCTKKRAEPPQLGEICTIYSYLQCPVMSAPPDKNGSKSPTGSRQLATVTHEAERTSVFKI